MADLTNCCCAPFWLETDICSRCKEHAEPIEKACCFDLPDDEHHSWCDSDEAGCREYHYRKERR